MKNFKEIAEKCLAGELSGIFIMRKDKPIHSNCLGRRVYLGEIIPNYYRLGLNIFTEKGDCIRNKEHVEDFIPDTMTQKKIEIDIPEGKVPVMEQTENGVVITWKEKELTYDGIIDEIAGGPKHIIGFSYNVINDTTSSTPFYRKVDVLRKLTNIRNYFGKRTTNIGYVIAMEFGEIIVIEIKTPLCFSGDVIFAKKEHAEQAIKMLGDELKYLFEPW